MNADAIDRLRDTINSAKAMRDAERRINIKMAITWGAFFLIAALLWVTR